MWDIVRVARNPFNLKPRCTKVEDEEGQVHSDIAAAFIEHNLIIEPREEKEEGNKATEPV